MVVELERFVLAAAREATQLLENMQTTGERFEEARKRKGISLREAAEATKIRTDFLNGIEQNNLDFDLPEIYKNGFIKNYARYLKLDPDQILTDYQAQLLGKTRLGRKNGAELFGTMDLKKPAHEPTQEESIESRDRHQLGRMDTRKTEEDREPSESERHGDDSDKIFYIKAGLIFVGTLAFVVIIFGLVKAILGSGGSGAPDQPALRNQPPAVTNQVEPTQPTANVGAAAGRDSLTLTATGNVYVAVQQQSDKKDLYRGTLSAGDSVPLTRKGPVVVTFTAGENLIIETGGERLQPSASGIAKITVD